MRRSNVFGTHPATLHCDDGISAVGSLFAELGLPQVPVALYDGLGWINPTIVDVAVSPNVIVENRVHSTSLDVAPPPVTSLVELWPAPVGWGITNGPLMIWTLPTRFEPGAQGNLMDFNAGVAPFDPRWPFFTCMLATAFKRANVAMPFPNSLLTFMSDYTPTDMPSEGWLRLDSAYGQYPGATTSRTGPTAGTEPFLKSVIDAFSVQPPSLLDALLWLDAVGWYGIQRRHGTAPSVVSVFISFLLNCQLSNGVGAERERVFHTIMCADQRYHAIHAATAVFPSHSPGGYVYKSPGVVLQGKPFCDDSTSTAGVTSTASSWRVTVVAAGTVATNMVLGSRCLFVPADGVSTASAGQILSILGFDFAVGFVFTYKGHAISPKVMFADENEVAAEPLVFGPLSQLFNAQINLGEAIEGGLGLMSFRAAIARLCPELCQFFRSRVSSLNPLGRWPFATAVFAVPNYGQGYDWQALHDIQTTFPSFRSTPGANHFYANGGLAAGHGRIWNPTLPHRVALERAGRAPVGGAHAAAAAPVLAGGNAVLAGILAPVAGVAPPAPPMAPMQVQTPHVNVAEQQVAPSFVHNRQQARLVGQQVIVRSHPPYVPPPAVAADGGLAYNAAGVPFNPNIAVPLGGLYGTPPPPAPIAVPRIEAISGLIIELMPAGQLVSSYTYAGYTMTPQDAFVLLASLQVALTSGEYPNFVNRFILNRELPSAPNPRRAVTTSVTARVAVPLLRILPSALEVRARPVFGPTGTI